jgi:hypothetical protein
VKGFRPGRPFWVVVVLMALLVVTACAVTAVGVGGAGPAGAAAQRPSQAAAAGSGPAWKDVMLALASLGSALVAGAALLVSMWNTDRTIAMTEASSRAQRQRETNRAELARLEALVATFHVPYLVLARANNNMAQDLRDRFADPGYRLLLSLFRPGWLASLSRGDRTLVREICATGMRLRTFIEERAGGTDPGLADHLARASTHFRILWLAYRRRLGDDPAPFARYVYPHQLDIALQADLGRIEKRIAQLRAEPETAHPAMPALVIPSGAALDSWPNPPRL